MKIGFFADLHGTNETPKCRLDSYVKTQRKKFLQMLDIFDLNGCQLLINAGDFFDSPKVPYKTSNWYLKTLRNKWCGTPILSVAGQHDQINHTMKLENTPYSTMISAGVFEHLDNEPGMFVDSVSGKEIHIYGRSWGEPVPEIMDKSKFNILVIHEMIVQEKLWTGQKNPIYANQFIKDHPFNLIICGDNHTPFIERYRSRVLVMCGSVTRKVVSQHDYSPSVYVFDTNELKLTTAPLRIKKDAVNLEEHKDEKKKKSDLERFVALLDKKEICKDFVSTVEEEIRRLKDKAVQSVATDILNSVL